MSGSPSDITNGNIGRVWHKIDAMDEKLDQVVTDVAVIKEQVGRLCKEDTKQDDRSFNRKQGIFMAAIGVIFGIIGSFLSSFFNR